LPTSPTSFNKEIMRAVIYARVSTHDQNTIPMQVKKCQEYAKARNWIVSHVMKDIASGAKQKPQRDDILKLARKREIDIVIVWKLDRWGRSTADVVSSLQELQELNVKFISITEALDFTTAMGRAMSGLLSVFAEFERELIRERVRAGLEQARSRGVRLGRPPLVQLKENEIKAHLKKTKNISETARKFKVSRRSIGRIIKTS
jgi:putative DNA-invertase from lambdoid prophage Rac